MRDRAEIRPVVLLLACLLCLLPSSDAQAKSSGHLPDFGDFPVQRVFQGKHTRARIVSKYQKLFRTRIRESVDDGVNFAGHYIVAAWGCGAGCTQFAVIDAVSGHVYDPPRSMRWVGTNVYRDSNRGPQYPDRINVKPDSALMVVEGCPSEGEKCGRFYYHFEEGRYKLVHFDPDPPEKLAK